MASQWVFGWTQLLTIIGFLITTGIAVGGFRTFNRWKREKLEEKKIEIAFEALSLAYEAKYVFEHIRSPMAHSHEWEDMPERPGDSEAKRNTRGSFYAVRKRVIGQKDYFERLFKLQPRLMAVFGSKTEEVFMLAHKARREIEVSAEMLQSRVDDTSNIDRKFLNSFGRTFGLHTASLQKKATVSGRR